MFRTYNTGSLIYNKAGIALRGPSPYFPIAWTETNVAAILIAGTGVSGFRNYIHKSIYSTRVTSRLAGYTSTARAGPGGTGNSVVSFHAGGYVNSTRYTAVDKYVYSTDTCTANSSQLSAARDGVGASGNASAGWFSGGSNGSTAQSSIAKVIYDTDTVSAFGSSLGTARSHTRSVNSSETLYLGPGFGATTTVEKMPFSNETISVASSCNVSKGYYGALNSLSNMYFCGGGISDGNANNVITKASYATETWASIASVTSVNRGLTRGSQSTSIGIVIGGLNVSTYYASTDLVDFATDTCSQTAGLALSEALCLVSAAG